MPNQKTNPLSSVELDMIGRRFGMRGGYLMKDRMRDYPVSRLTPHPKNESIYGSEDVKDLVEQIQSYGGIVDPLKIKEDGTIISGHRRWKAAQELGMEKVPCEIVTYDSEEEELAALVLFNYHRAKTNEQRAREGMALEEALRAEGMIRKLSNLKQNMPKGPPGPTRKQLMRIVVPRKLRVGPARKAVLVIRLLMPSKLVLAGTLNG